MPRVSRELEATRQEATFLKRHMENVKIGLENVESKTNNSIQVLLSIDQVKERVERSEKGLVLNELCRVAILKFLMLKFFLNR